MSNTSKRDCAVQTFKRFFIRFTIGMYLISLVGCGSVLISLAGLGAGAGVNHQLNGIATRTFTEPTPKVKKAVFVALQRMAIKYPVSEKKETIELITATAGERNIEIEIENLSTQLTKVSVVARLNAFQVDGATAQEIIAQTSKALGSG